MIFFDFSPFEQLIMGGYRVRFHIYSLPGAVSNAAAWRMTLKGADGIIVVIDGAPGRGADLTESLDRLRDYLAAYGGGLDNVPLIVQINKHDLTDGSAAPSSECYPRGGLTICRSSALKGDGVLEAFSALSHQVIERVGHDLHGAEPQPGEQPETREPEHIAPEAGIDEPQDETLCRPAGDNARLTVALSGDITADGSTLLSVPLEISLGGERRTVVVSLTLKD